MSQSYLTLASTQYCDFCGTFSADANPDLSIIKMLEDFKFDFESFFPFSIKFFYEQPFSNNTDSLNIVIAAVDKKSIADNIPDLKKYADKNNNHVPAARFCYKLTNEKFFNLFKRMEIDFGIYSKQSHDHSNTLDIDFQD